MTGALLVAGPLLAGALVAGALVDCHQSVVSPVFGVRGNTALRRYKPWTEARATTSVVDCQMKNAPMASRQVAAAELLQRATTDEAHRAGEDRAVALVTGWPSLRDGWETAKKYLYE